MKLKNILIVVKDIEKSKQFYHDLFGLDVVLDQDGNMILTEGLVLQDAQIWKEFLGQDANYILKKKTWKHLWKSWTDCILLLNMSTSSWNIVGVRRWFVFMIWMEI